VTSTTSVSSGTPTALPAVYNGTLYNHFLSVDGNNWVISGDGANNAVASGIDVYDSVDNLALGTYKGCAIPAGTTTCGVFVLNSNGGAAIQGPRGTAIDSSGDVWVTSTGSQNLTELIGAAAPTWPGLSMAKFGLPQ
jgi:pyruvate/2-oxoacid:ferredoxin oxidoreductase beta subunit